MMSGCKHYGDCFTCPYSDCILNDLEAAQADAADGINQEKKRSPRYEANHRWYMAKRKELLEKQRMYREKRKAGLPQKEGNKTADWNEYHRKYYEAHKAEIRARNRKYYMERRKKNGIDIMADLISNSDCYSKVD